MPTKVFITIPNTKPRMTRRDSWVMAKINAGKKLNKREEPRARTLTCWMAYKDSIRLQLDKFNMPLCGYHITFYIPMPESWSKKKKIRMNEKPHQQTPDKDNLEKAFLDTILQQDCTVWDGRVTKLWSKMGKIIITWGEDGS